MARATGVSLRSVKRIAKEPELDHTTDAEERRRRGIGRPSIVRAYRKLVVELLGEDAGLRSAEILRRVRAEGYAGGKSAMYALIATLRSVAATGANRSVAATVAGGHSRPETSEGLGAR